MPSFAARWSSPKECADELLEVFGGHWGSMLAIELGRRIRGA